MWQDILAVDSRLSEQRMTSMADPHLQNNYRPLYLKRRLQLLQAQQYARPECCPNERDEALMIKHRPILRNRKYLSLRVKLLKGQLGLPSDLMSLKSLSISTSSPSPSPSKSDERGFTASGKASQPPSKWSASTSNQTSHPAAQSVVQRCAYNGVHRVLALQHRGSITRIRFARSSPDVLLASASDGSLTIHRLAGGTANKDDVGQTLPSAGGHSAAITDFDLSLTDEFLVSASMDGSLVLWHLPDAVQLRKLQGDSFSGGGYVTSCRFVPGNNNLVVCTMSIGTVHLINFSTGKFSGEACSLVHGKTMCVELDQQGILMWVGNDRGYIESFRLECKPNKIQKGCRLHANPFNRAVTSLSSYSGQNRLTRSACLVATMGTDHCYLFQVLDAFGTLASLRSFSACMPSVLCHVLFAPDPGNQPDRPGGGVCLVSGAQDGSLVFFDVERDSKPCVNKLLGHSTTVTSLCYSMDEHFLASADNSGQIIVWKKC